jgi:hypothetical protein
LLHVLFLKNMGIRDSRSEELCVAKAVKMPQNHSTFSKSAFEGL